MLSAVTILLAIAGCSLASPGANIYVDTLLQGPLLRELNYAALNPTILSNFTTHFEDKVVIIGKVKGQANYYNGTLFGLENVVRYTECQGPMYSFGSGTINCSLAFNYIRTEHRGKVKYGKLPNVDIKAKSNITRSVVFVEFIQHYNQQPQLKTIRFQEVGQVQPKFTGLGNPLNKYLKVLEDGYKASVGAEFYNVITQRFQYALNRAASQIIMPTYI